MTDRMGAAPEQSDGPMVFVNDVEAPELDPGDLHHLRRVLRVRDGEQIVCCDGVGNWRLARFDECPESTSEVAHVQAPLERLGVGFALLKGDRPELIVQKLTELGIDWIQPLICDHNVIRWSEEKARRNTERLQAVARSASMQCRRTWLPHVELPCGIPQAMNHSPAAVARADKFGEPLSAGIHTLLVGPEGGWSTAEQSVDGPTVRIAEHMLRAETAAIAAGTLLSAVRDGLILPTR